MYVFAHVVTSKHGIKYRYMQTLELPDGRAETIENALLTCPEDYGIDMQKVVGFRSDGASVMVGSRGAVALG